MTPSDVSVDVPVTVVLAAWLVGLLFSGMLLLLLGGVWSRVRARWNSGAQKWFGATFTTRALTLVLAMLPFIGELVALPRVLASFVKDLLIGLPLGTVEFVLSSARPTSMTALFQVLPGAYLQSLGQLLSPGEDRPSALPQYVFYVVFLWLVLGQLSSPVQAAGGDSRPRIQAILEGIYEAIGVARLKNAAFLCLLGVGLYLSITAIAAIPILAATDSTAQREDPRKRLETYLAEMDKGSLLDVPRLDDSAAAQRFAAMQAYLREGPEWMRATPAAEPAPPVKAVVHTGGVTQAGPRTRFFQETAQAWVELATFETRRLEDVMERDSYYEQARDQRRKYRQQVLGEFTQNAHGRRSSREMEVYFYELANWYGEVTHGLEAYAIYCAPDPRNVDLEFTRWSQALQSRFSHEGKTATPSSEAERAALAPRGVSLQSDVKCAGAMPPLPPPGSLPQLKPFGAVSLGKGFFTMFGWMLAPESLSLALIIGMMGFGLLGSTVSTAVKQKRDATRTSKLLVDDLSGVLIRGVSAAVVVFLAAEGGLAILSVDSIQPNPYVLMLTCLVGAVFSEQVWERTSAWFSSMGSKAGATGAGAQQGAVPQQGAGGQPAAPGWTPLQTGGAVPPPAPTQEVRQPPPASGLTPLQPGMVIPPPSGGNPGSGR